MTVLIALPEEPLQLALPLYRLPPILPTSRAAGPGQLHHNASRFMQAVAEVICGERPARQLGGWLTAEVAEKLVRSPRSTTRSRGRVASVHVTMITPAIAEVYARMVVNGRSHAIAARLDRSLDSRRRHTWRCSALEWA